jgi:hypothetical protein
MRRMSKHYRMSRSYKEVRSSKEEVPTLISSPGFISDGKGYN